MKYVQPIGGASNDPYVDANPAGGIEGSPVPAAALEHPMRELVALISDAGLTPTEADLTQIAKAVRTLIQRQSPVISAAGGTADALTAAYTPAIASLTNGMTLYVRAGSANATTTPTFTPNNGTITAKTIVKGAGSALAAGDIAGAGHWIALQYDATLDKWVLLNPATGVSTSSGAFTAAGGIGINANRTIAAGEINGWGQIQAAGTTTTLPTLASTRVGASFTLSGGSYGGTLKGAGAEVIIGPTGNSANTYKIGPGETVTVANNTIGWWVVAAGAAAADLQRQAYTAFSTAGAAPAYTLTPVPAVGALAANQRFRVLFHAPGTTGSNTLNVSGLGAVTLYQYDPTGAKTPAVIPAAGMLADVEYDGVFWILLNPLPTSEAPSPVRQTVLGGPVDAAGAPSFLPATAGGLSITSQNVAAGTPMVVSAANGFAGAGAVDRIGMSTAPLTWSGLAANTTVYLYVDVSATGVLTPGSTTLAPTYQWGGARSTVSGQATYNIAEASMTVGNGSAAAQTYRVFVGEAVTGAGSVTSTVAYAYQGRSAFLQSNLAVGTTYAFGANIGTPAPMQVVTGWLECKTAELGYAVGESIGVTWAVNPYIAAQSVYMTTVNRNRVDIVTGATNIGTTAKAGTTGVGLTTANWQLRATATRGW